MQPIVFVIDDDAAVREALALLLRSVELAVETFPSATEFLEAIEASRLQTSRACVVTDVRMPGMSGLDLQAVLAQRSIQIPIVVISGHADVPQAVRAMRAGALTFLEKPVNEQELIDTIHEALNGHGRHDTISHSSALEDQRARLTERQRDVFDHLMRGLQTKEVAKELGLSPRTVEVHRAKILERLQASSFSQLLQQLLAHSGRH